MIIHISQKHTRREEEQEHKRFLRKENIKYTTGEKKSFLQKLWSFAPCFKNRRPGHVQTYFLLSFLFLQKKCNPFYFSLFLQYLKGIKTSNVLT